MVTHEDEWPLTPLYVSVFLSCTTFAIIMPTIALYLDHLGASAHWLSLTIAIYSVGETLGSPVAGWAASRMPTKPLLIGMLFLGVAGGAMYATAQAPWMVVVARFVMGLWTGGDQAVGSAYLGRAVSTEQRTAKMTTLAIAVSLGLALGPAFGLLGTFGDHSVGKLHFNAFTVPGWIGVVFALSTAVLLGIWFKEKPLHEGDSVQPSSDVPSIQGHELTHSTTFGDSSMAEDHFLDHGSAFDEEEEEYGDAERLLGAQGSGAPLSQAQRAAMIMAFLALNFANLFAFSMIETIVTPLAQSFYGYTPRQANFLFLGAGMLQLVTFLGLLQALKRGASERLLLLGGLALDTLAFGLMIGHGSGSVDPSSSSSASSSSSGGPTHDLPEWRFLLGFAIFNVGFPVARTLMYGLYSKLCDRIQVTQGIAMGMLVGSGASARVAGPFVAVFAFQSSILVLFAVVVGVHVLALMACFFLNRHLAAEDGPTGRTAEAEEEQSLLPGKA